ncbi:MAG: hypothetical protein R3247_11915 [Rhodothermales bacterium]|nr:hypothetical protein [Rhodothermales bacterium]
MYKRLSLAGLVAMGLLCGCAGQDVLAQREFFSMDDRINQHIAVLTEVGDCSAVEVALRTFPAALYGGARIVPSRGELERETREADQKTAENERRVVAAIEAMLGQGRCPALHGLAVDVKTLVKETNEVAVAVAPATTRCGDGSTLEERFCNLIQPLLDEETGHEIFDDRAGVIRPGFFVKLRSPFVPWNTVFGWEEDLYRTDPIAPGECAAIVKETRGLMLRLIFVRFDIVRDPWATPLLARGTRIPIWALEWIPSQYVKTWNVCNQDGRLATTVSQRVKQDVPLNFFWRYYPAAGHGGKGDY